MSYPVVLKAVLGTSVRLLGDLAGTGYPLVKEKNTKPAFLNALLQQHGTTEDYRGARIAACEPRDLIVESSNCVNLVLDVHWEDAAGLPESLFLKVPDPRLVTRWFCNLMGVWRLECRVLREFAGDFPLRMPRTLVAAERGASFVLLQENLQDEPNIRLFDNRTMILGPDTDTVLRCLSGFARLHAHYHGFSEELREQRLPIATHPFLSPSVAPVSKFINIAAIDRSLEKAGDVFTADHAELLRRAMHRWTELQNLWYAGPLTLVHGDSHIGNVFLDNGAMGMLDFQATHWGKGLRDVHYHLCNSVPAEFLAANERDWVGYYLEELARQGVQLDADQAWEDYRGLSLQTLMTHVVSLGLGPLTESDSLMKELLHRAVKGIERLDVEGWLDANLN